MLVRKLFTLIGFKTDKKGFRDADKSINKIKQTLIRVAGILVAGKVIKGIAGIATETAKLADEVSKVADKLGVGTSALQEFRFAAQLTGVAQRTADLALQRFTRRTAEAAQGTGEAKDALRELGVRLTDTQGRLRPVSELLADAAEGLKNAKTQGDRLRLSFKLFDSEGAALVNTLKGGRDAFNAMAQVARDTGGIFDDRHAELFSQTLRVDLDAAGIGHVAHVQRDDGGQSQFQHLADQIQVSLQVAGIDDADDRLWLLLLVAPPQQHVNRDHFVGRARGEAVGARQIDQRECLPAGAHLADLFFDRHPGIIPHPLSRSDQRIKQRRLARVGIAHQRDGHSSIDL